MGLVGYSLHCLVRVIPIGNQAVIDRGFLHRLSRQQSDYSGVAMVELSIAEGWGEDRERVQTSLAAWR